MRSATANRNGLVSVIIPTLNAENTLEKCVNSIRNQAYKNVEILVVDSFSKDRTSKIAGKLGCRVIETRWKLLGARFLGLKNSKGSFVLMLDSDQILKNRNVIGNALRLAKNYDMLVLEECSYHPRTWLEKLANADRKLVHSIGDVQFDPVEGTLLPRFFRKSVLSRAFKNIDMSKLHDVVIFDHVIIYYEAYKISNRVGMVKDAVWHSEPDNITDLLKHNYRYGVTAKELVRSGHYIDLINKKTRFRAGGLKSRNVSLILQSDLLVILKGIAYELGYLIG